MNGSSESSVTRDTDVSPTSTVSTDYTQHSNSADPVPTNENAHWVENLPHSSRDADLKRENHSPPSIDDKVRWFLVAWTALLTLLVFIAYLDTKDIRVLFSGTIVAIAVWFVYSFYFHKKP